MELLKKIECLIKEYEALEITNIDATGVKQERAVYFFDKRYSRRGNVFLELWQNEQKEMYSFIFNRELLTPQENNEVDQNRRPTANRGSLYRYNMSVQDMIEFIRSKLDLYYIKHGLKKEKKEDINVPMRPIKIEKDENDCIILTCAKCNQKFQKSSRCSFCGQKVLITEDDIQNIKNKRKLIDLDDWIHESDFGEISPSEMQRCISLILESGFIYHVGTSDLSLDYKFKEGVILRNMVMFWGEGSRMVIQPSILFDFVSELSIGKECIEDYLISLTKYLSPKQKNKPYDNIKGYYFIDYSTFIEKCDEIIDLHKELVDKIFQKI